MSGKIKILKSNYFTDITNAKLIDDIIYRKNENELLVSFNKQGTLTRLF